MSSSKQARIDDYGSIPYQQGDLLHDTSSGRSTKLQLTECPICRVDPSRPRHRFQPQESRARHFHTHHSAGDV